MNGHVMKYTRGLLSKEIFYKMVHLCWYDTWSVKDLSKKLMVDPYTIIRTITLLKDMRHEFFKWKIIIHDAECIQNGDSRTLRIEENKSTRI